jgi:hypothetical protein
MRIPDLTATPMRVRRRVYLACLAAGLFGWLLLGASFEFAYRIPGIQLLFLASAALAVGGLRWLRPLRLPYGFGVACLILASIGGWLGGPDGTHRIGDQLLQHPGYRSHAGRAFVGLFAFGFLLGWHLLAVSVARWWTGVLLYLGGGLLSATVIFGSWILANLRDLPSAVWIGEAFVWSIVVVGLLWPGSLLQLLHVFGWRPPD